MMAPLANYWGPIYCTRYYRIVRSQTDQPPVSSLIQQRRLKLLFGHNIARAAASEDHSRALRSSTDHLSVDWRRPRGRPVSPGFEQSTAISNHSTLDFTLHCSEHRIVLPGDASWKRLCSLSVPPDDDDDYAPCSGQKFCNMNADSRSVCSN